MSKIQVKAHTSFLGHTGYNNHSKNFFTNLNKYIPTRVRNYSYCDDLSYLKPEERSLLIEQEWKDPPYKIGSPFVRDPEATLVDIVLNESHHYYFYDNLLWRINFSICLIELLWVTNCRIPFTPAQVSHDKQYEAISSWY